MSPSRGSVRLVGETSSEVVVVDGVARTGRDEWRIIDELYPSLRRFAAVTAPVDMEPDDLLQEALVKVLGSHDDQTSPRMTRDSSTAQNRQYLAVLGRSICADMGGCRVGGNAGDSGCHTWNAAERQEADMAEHLVGNVSHYYGALGVVGIELVGELKVGDTIHIHGYTSDFTQTVDSIQIEHETVESAKAGDPAGVKVVKRARVHDQVFVVLPD